MDEGNGQVGQDQTEYQQIEQQRGRLFDFRTKIRLFVFVFAIIVWIYVEYRNARSADRIYRMLYDTATYQYKKFDGAKVSKFDKDKIEPGYIVEADFGYGKLKYAEYYVDVDFSWIAGEFGRQSGNDTVTVYYYNGKDAALGTREHIHVDNFFKDVYETLGYEGGQEDAYGINVFVDDGSYVNTPPYEERHTWKNETYQ